MQVGKRTGAFSGHSTGPKGIKGQHTSPFLFDIIQQLLLQQHLRNQAILQHFGLFSESKRPKHPNKMHFSKVFTLTALFAAGAFALPNAEPNTPPKPPKPSPTSVNQQNVCGNNVTPYCCTADGYGGYNSCYAFCKTITNTPLRYSRFGLHRAL